MKKHLFSILAVLTSLLTLSCESNGNSTDRSSEGELVFSQTVREMADGLLTRASGNDFFDVGYPIDVFITRNSAGATEERYEYIYRDNGTFTGSPGFRFNLDDNYISSLTALWPTDSIRKLGVITDQRELEDHRKADWMNATASLKGIVPTDAPVPLNFNRENSMLYFELAGQNSRGLNITSLVLELSYESKPTAFWAYCGYDDGHAELIITPDTSIESKENYLIGRLAVNNNAEEYTIIFPYTKIDLQPGTRYLVTLTPVGYDMTMFAFIQGWYQHEGGIGIPFTPQDEDGSFTVYTPEQLIAMSYLIRHYIPSEFDWPSYTYHISDQIQITDEQAALYIPLRRGVDFTGSIRMNGIEIESIEYGDGQLLQLYVTE